MRITSLLRGLLILPLGMFGCSQIGTVRKPPGDDVKTVASVGDNSLPIRSGTPDSSVRAQDTPPVLPTPSRGRISGRVYDERGKPVPSAKVRLAVGGETGGKAVSAVTDRSGAFTLRGLRPGSSYTVIAEYQGENGLMTGRVEAEAPDADVRIGLQRRAAGLDDVRTTIRPARPNVEPISNVEESDEPENTGPLSSRTNREDFEPPALEADAMRGGDPSGSQTEPRVSAATGSTSKSTGWTQGHRSADRRGAGQGGSSRSGAADAAARASRPPQGIEGDDEENPLPPALEPEKVGSSLQSEDAPDRSIALARGQSSSPALRRRASATRSTPALAADAGPDEDLASSDRSPPQPFPRGVVAGARSVTTDAFAPLLMSDPEASPRQPAGAPRRATRDLQAPSANLAPRPAPAAAPTEPTRPTWGELVFKKEPIPLDESLQQVSRDLAVKATRGVPDEGSKAAAAIATASSATRSAALATGTKVTCQFNADERRLVDFRLPDSQGQMVSFHDFDADLILLDFWGTWCAPCRKSIPHLIEIQQTLGGKKVQVVGIACERTPAKDRAAGVARSLKELKINYPVLISSMDGTCPVQDAFQIQFYPTLVLIDRQGRILWREQGATDVTLARMDRFILKNLNRASVTSDDALQARVARAKNQDPR